MITYRGKQIKGTPHYWLGKDIGVILKGGKEFEIQETGEVFLKGQHLDRWFLSLVDHGVCFDGASIRYFDTPGDAITHGLIPA